MSDKHLTEAPWKSLLTKHKLKDTGVGKALASLKAAPESDFEARLKALDALQTAVTMALKDKALKANEDAADYLEEIEREEGKLRKVLEASKAAAEKEEDSEEDDDEGVGGDAAAIKKKVSGMLSKIRSKAPEDPAVQFMALITKAKTGVWFAATVGGGTKNVLLGIVPKPVGPTYVEGTCRWEGGKYVFEVDSAAPRLAKSLRSALVRQAEITQKVLVRTKDGKEVDADAEPDDDESPETESGEGEPSAETAPPKTGDPTAKPQDTGEAAQEEAQAAFVTRYKVLKPSIDKAAAGTTPEAAEIKRLTAEVVAQARLKAFGPAEKGLDAIEKLLQPAQTPQAVFAENLKALKPDIDRVVTAQVPAATEVRTLFAEVKTLAQAKDLPAANAAFLRLEATVKIALTQIAAKKEAEEKAAAEKKADPTADDAKAFRDRLSALFPHMKAAIAGGGPVAAEIRRLATEAGALAKAGQYEAAGALADQLEALLEARDRGESGGFTQESPEAEYTRIVGTLEGDYLEALKARGSSPEADQLVARLKLIWEFAMDKAEGDSFAAALKSMARIGEEDLFAKIRKLQAATSARPVKKGGGLVAQRQYFLTRWKQIPAELASHVSSLKSSLEASFPDDGTVGEVTTKLNAYLVTLLETLQDRINDVIDGDLSKDPLASVRKEIDQNDILSQLRAYPLADGAVFTQTLLNAVEEVGARLAA